MSTKKKAARNSAPRLTVKQVSDYAHGVSGTARAAFEQVTIARRETGDIMNRLVAIERALERNDTIAKANRAPEVCAEINKLILTNNDQMRSEVAQIAKTLDCHAQINSANSQQIGDVRTRLNQITVEMEGSAAAFKLIESRVYKLECIANEIREQLASVESGFGKRFEDVESLVDALYEKPTIWQRIKGWFV